IASGFGCSRAAAGGVSSAQPISNDSWKDRLAAARCQDEILALINELAAQRQVGVGSPVIAMSPITDGTTAGSAVAFNAGAAEPLRDRPQPGAFLALVGIAGGE